MMKYNPKGIDLQRPRMGWCNTRTDL